MNVGQSERKIERHSLHGSVLKNGQFNVKLIQISNHAYQYTDNYDYFSQ